MEPTTQPLNSLATLEDFEDKEAMKATLGVVNRRQEECLGWPLLSLSFTSMLLDRMLWARASIRLYLQKRSSSAPRRHGISLPDIAAIVCYLLFEGQVLLVDLVFLSPMAHAEVMLARLLLTSSLALAVLDVDDECSDSTCALNALQMRRELQDWAPSGHMRPLSLLTCAGAQRDQ